MPRKALVLLLPMIVTTSGIGLAQDSGKPSKATLIKARRLIDVRGSRVLTDRAILVVDERIKAVGETGEILKSAPKDATVIDLLNSTVLPGLIDCHTHVLLQGDITQADYDEQLLKESIPFRTIRATVAAKTALMNGFTAIRDLETEGAMYADVDVKLRHSAGHHPRPPHVRLDQGLFGDRASRPLNFVTINCPSLFLKGFRSRIRPVPRRPRVRLRHEQALNELARRVKDLHAVVAAVGDVNPPLLVARHALGEAEMIVVIARHAFNAQKRLGDGRGFVVAHPVYRVLGELLLSHHRINPANGETIQHPRTQPGNVHPLPLRADAQPAGAGDAVKNGFPVEVPTFGHGAVRCPGRIKRSPF